MVPFLKTFRVEKGNGLSPFAVNIVGPHALVESVKENFKIPTLHKRGCRTGAVDDFPHLGQDSTDVFHHGSEEEVDVVLGRG